MKVMKNKVVKTMPFKGAAQPGPAEMVKGPKHSSSGKGIVAPKGRMPKVK